MSPSPVGLVNETFKLNLQILRIMGLYPTQSCKNIYKIYAVLIFLFLIPPPPILMAVYLLLAESVTMEMLSDSAFLIFQCSSFTVKLLPFIFNAKEVRRIFYSLEDPIFNSYTKNQEIFVKKFIKASKQNTYLFLGFCLCSLFLWSSRPIFIRTYVLPTKYYTPYDPYQNHLVFGLSCLYLIIGIGEGAISNGVLDPLVAGLLIFATCQVNILKDNLKNLDKFEEHDVSIKSLPKNKNEIIYERIQNCINHHNAILKFVEDFEKTFSPVVFTQFAASVSVVCVTILQMSLVSPTSFIFFQMSVFFLTMLIEIFLYCYYGTYLYDESNSLTNAIYMGNWYEYDIKSQKALIMIMERVKKPMKVTAGKILDLSLETFTTILRRSYSLLAVLKNY